MRTEKAHEDVSVARAKILRLEKALTDATYELQHKEQLAAEAEAADEDIEREDWKNRVKHADVSIIEVHICDHCGATKSKSIYEPWEYCSCGNGYILRPVRITIPRSVRSMLSPWSNKSIPPHQGLATPGVLHVTDIQPGAENEAIFNQYVSRVFDDN